MNTTTYKGYTILTVGLSRYIYRPGQSIPGYYERGSGAAGHATTRDGARRWINADRAKAA